MPFKKGGVPWNKTESKSICNYCKKEFPISPSRLKDTKIKRGVYCSKKCTDSARVGTLAWNSGLKGREYTQHYPKGFGGVFYSAEKSFLGSREEYMALHHWVRKNLGKPTECSSCRKTFSGKKIQWANKSGEYKKYPCDWLRLCAKCHFIYDKTNSRRKTSSTS